MQNNRLWPWPVHLHACAQAACAAALCTICCRRRHHTAQGDASKTLSLHLQVQLTHAVQVLGAPLAAALLLMEGVGGLRGWQWLFIIEGAATGLWGVVLAVSPCHITLLRPAPGGHICRKYSSVEMSVRTALRLAIPLDARHMLRLRIEDVA